MSSADPPLDTSPRRPRRRLVRRGVGSLVVTLLTTAVLGAVVYVLIGRPVSAPDWLRDRVAAEVGAALGEAELRFDALDFVVDDGMVPRARMTNVQIQTATGAEIVAFGDVRVAVSLADLVQGQLRPTEIALSGIFAQLRRLSDGEFVLSGGLDLSSPNQQAANFAQLIEPIDALLSTPALSALEIGDIQSLTLRVEDVQTGRAWTVDGGRLRLTRSGDAVRITSDLALLSGGQGVATLEANYESRIGSAAAAFGLSVADVDAGDVAALAAPFGWLDVLRAPISGAVRGGFAEDGTLAPLNVSLTIGAGVIQPTDATRPVPFSSARSYFTFNPQDQLLSFDELSVKSAWISGAIEGQAVLGVDARGQLEDLVGQFRANAFSANPDGLYPEPVSVDAVDLDFRMGLDPFQLDIGQLVVQDGPQTVRARGVLEAAAAGWRYRLDAQVDTLTPERLLALWPEAAIPRTRAWLLENLRAGQLNNIDLALRDEPDAKPNVYASFDFEGADVQYARTLPPVRDARGTFSLLDNRLVVVVDQGVVTPDAGGRVRVDGSSFIIPDVGAGPEVPAVVRLETQGTVTAALSLLDAPPLRIFEKAGLATTIVEGQLQAAGTLSLPLKKGLKPTDLSYSATGTARDVRSTALIKGRTLAADTLRIAARETGVEISGQGTLDGVPFDAVWTQPIGSTPQAQTITGTFDITPAAVKAFEIGLPDDMVRGRGTGRIAVEVPPGGAPRFVASSDLRGVGLSIPPLGWSKSAASAVSLDVEGTFGPVPNIASLALSAPGLRAQGAIDLRETGGLARARFSSVEIGDWLRAPVDLIGRGPGAAPGIDVRGGTLDLRKADFGGGASANTAGAQDAGPLTLRLDTVQVTDSIAVSDMEGEFSMARGLDGAFTGRVNGGTPISGQILPQNGRSAIRIRSDDAGGVAASAGILKQARGGALSLTLNPVGAASFDGDLRIEQTRVTDAPAIAALLNALSIIGLLEQMGGSGIHFEEVEAAFRLTPSTMTLTKASATGPSMGLSMDGIYDVAGARLDMQGVVSPLYLLNGIGSIFTRKGEGLIGFSYRLRGPASNPQVQVNPLSALTPGMFREIFRRPAPQVSVDDSEDAAPTFADPQVMTQADAEARRRARQQEIENR